MARIADGVDIDDIGKIEELPRLLFIDEECGNRKVFVDGGQLTRNINKKEKSVVLPAYRCPLCDKCCGRECFFINHVE